MMSKTSRTVWTGLLRTETDKLVDMVMDSDEWNPFEVHTVSVVEYLPNDAIAVIGMRETGMRIEDVGARGDHGSRWGWSWGRCGSGSKSRLLDNHWEITFGLQRVRPHHLRSILIQVRDGKHLDYQHDKRQNQDRARFHSGTFSWKNAPCT